MGLNEFLVIHSLKVVKEKYFVFLFAEVDQSSIDVLLPGISDSLTPFFVTQYKTSSKLPPDGSETPWLQNSCP